MKYFKLKEGPITEEILKLLWRKLAVKLHPDKGGSEEAFKEAQAEYEVLLGRIGSTINAYQDTPEHYNSWEDFLADVSPAVKECLQETRKAGARRLEVCGRWIWVSLKPDEIQIRVQLKEICVNGIKYRFSKNKKKWYWAGVKCRSRGSHDMEYIRSMYGSSNYKATEPEEIESH